MTPLQSAYAALSKASGIKEGDTVKVPRKAKSNELGWDNNWDCADMEIADTMDNAVGKTFTVDHVCANAEGILLEGNGYCFPFFVLEKMPTSKPVVPTEKTVMVDGACVRLEYCTSGRVVVAHFDEAGYQFDVEGLKEIIKESNKFLNRHQDAKKAS